MWPHAVRGGTFSMLQDFRAGLSRIFRHRSRGHNTHTREITFSIILQGLYTAVVIRSA